MASAVSNGEPVASYITVPSASPPTTTPVIVNNLATNRARNSPMTNRELYVVTTTL